MSTRFLFLVLIDKVYGDIANSLKSEEKEEGPQLVPIGKEEGAWLDYVYAVDVGPIVFNDKLFALIVLGIVSLQAVSLYLVGQPILSRSGKIKLWVGDVCSAENSQQLFDWYTFTHILHGFLFYALGKLFEETHPLAHLGFRGLLIPALLVEVLWELLENSPWVIQRYRQSALASGYTGDSILNSVSDVGAMSLGFWLASVLPLHISILFCVAEEALLPIIIRDNITLNLIQLIRPSDKISKWQTKKAFKNISNEESLKTEGIDEHGKNE